MRHLSVLLAIGAFLGIGLPADRIPPDQPRVSIAPRIPSPGANIRLEVRLVLIPVSVTDSRDHPVTDLRAHSFRLFEDNVEQKIVSFCQEEEPVSMGLIFDASGSMRRTIDRSVAAVEQFVNTSLPGDEFFLVRFSETPKLVTGFTTDTGMILRALRLVRPEGWTALHDAICLGTHLMKSARNPRRALFILSDGGDNNSRYHESEIKDLVMESDLRVYAIGLFERPRFLLKIATETGGNAFWVHKPEDLPEAVGKLSRALRSHYVLGFSSNNPQKDGRYRKVKVELLPSSGRAPLRISWRRGYYAPGN